MGNEFSDFGDFGKMSKSYSAGRRGYPDAVFYYLQVFAKENEPLLDLGCGTGISTRQLALYGFEDIQGVDSDEKMLDEAREHAKFKYIPYWIAEASSMPFRSQFFKGITCFSSFHWFNEEDGLKDSIVEIKRVLKKDGFLFIVNKEDITPFKEDIKAAIEAKLDVKFPEILNSEGIFEVLKNNGFRLETIKSFEGEDLYSLPEAVDYIKSTSYWAAINDEDKPDLIENLVVPRLQEIKEISKTEKDRIIRHYNATVIVAHKDAKK